MEKSSDGMVSPADIVTAIDEIKRGEGEKIMVRLSQTEPELALFVESIAAHLTNPRRVSKSRLDAMADAVDRILVIVRAIEIGHFRIWRDAFPPSSPLGRLMDPGKQDGPTNEQKK